MKYPHCLFLLAAAFLCSADAFTQSFSHCRGRHTTSIVTTSSMFLSDIPSDVDDSMEEEPAVSTTEIEGDVVTVESEDVETDWGTLVSDVLDLIPSTLGEVSETARAEINEVLYKLEALNPTDEPAKSSLLNGEWELKYSGGYVSEGALASPTRQIALFLYSGGYSPGIFALSLARKLPAGLVSVGDLKINIFDQQPRVQASVDLSLPFAGESSVQVKAALKTESDIRLRETYESAEVMGNTIEIPEMLQYSRELYVTYLDEDLLVVRDGSGIPELLVRPNKVSTM
ncbi:unnamed protein product [Cylindrotheca closterium]|uniref:Plastid lipid-associated protein/fibrillin conserved domain-containing protein n=1 Tax=Cylindrotheca closterium TaxID=2856 RepID=A0AAD2JGZ0_9STRA|nr:unnamed protein product [Cylindrotheca closterium]